MSVVRHLLAFIVLLCSGALLADNSPVLFPLTPEHGLSQGTVPHMMLDAKGFLWLATDGGLNRYDSARVNPVVDAQKSLQDTYFNKTIQLSDQSIWAATPIAGVFRYNFDSGWLEPYFDLPALPEGSGQHYLTDLIEFSSTQLLAATNQGIFLLDIATRQSSPLFQLPEQAPADEFIRVLHPYQDWLFIGTSHQLLLMELTTQQVHPIPYHQADANADQRHLKFFSIQDEQLWLGTVEGLYSLPLADITAFLHEQTSITATERIAERNIWHLEWRDQDALVATERGLYRFDPANNKLSFLWRFSDSQHQLIDNNIISMVADRQGGYWLGSRYDGAYYWHPRSQAFSHLGAQTSGDNLLSSIRVWVLAEAEPGELWVGTDNGLNRVQLQSGHIDAYLKNPDPKAVWHESTIFSLFPDAELGIFFSSATGLHLFDPVSASLQPLPFAEKSDAELLAAGSWHYWRDLQGAFWFFANEAFYRYQPADGSIQKLPALQPLAAYQFGGFLGYVPGSDDQLLLTTADKLWVYHQASGRLEQVFMAEHYNPGLYRIAENTLRDTKGRLWVAFNGVGILIFDQDFTLLHHFHQHNKLISNLVFSLQQDNAGYIWFSNHHGLFRMHPGSFHIERFNRHDGLLTHEYNGRAGIKLHDGRLAYGSMRGLTLIEPSYLHGYDEQNQAVITGLSLLDGSFTTPYGHLNNRVIQLPARAEGIQLNFSSMSFRDSQKASFRVWLEGKQAFHFPEQSDHQVIIPRLPAGEHRFHVVSVSPITGAESDTASLTLRIMAPWWASGPAYATYALLSLALLLVWLRNRQQQQRMLTMAHRKLKASEQRMKQALAAVDSGTWEWHASKNSLYASRISSMLGYRESLNPLTLEQHLSLIHPDDKPQFEHKWQSFLTQKANSFDHTYRLQHKDGHWLWFRDIGKIAELDDEQQVMRVLGTFSNITETRASQEKARLFGEAFQKTRDWVVILDEQQRMIAANQSFADAFGPVEHYLSNPQTHHLGISLDRRRYYTRLLRDFQVNQHWQGEEIIVTPDGRERPTLINISGIGEQNKVAFFVLVFTDITDQKLAEDELRYLANYDALTGLPNRALLMDRIHHGIETAKRSKRSLALCFLDLDRFKHINDSLGHDIGDLLLKEVARRLNLTLRESDTVARLGGDEFVVLLEGYKCNDNISHVARKMLQIIGEPMKLGPNTVGVSPSIGIAVYPDDAYTAFELMKHADVAMYHAKEAGRNNFQFFTREMNEKAHMQLARETRLRKAFQQQEFVNYYQPIIDSRHKSIIGAEVLLRWYSSDGVVSPAEFIPLAEDLSLIIPMTQHLLERALEDLQQWHRTGHPLYLSVNLSARHLEQPQLAEQVEALLSRYQLPAGSLRFEVTESALMRDHASAIATMNDLSALGIKLALDDFGTGYSSLKYLKELPIDAIKIDRSFVKDIGIDQNDEAIIETMLNMAATLGMYCVAEGVETEQQLRFFNERDCHFIQGYLFAQPMPANQLKQLLDSKRFDSGDKSGTG